jgi:hypothetical protein
VVSNGNRPEFISSILSFPSFVGRSTPTTSKHGLPFLSRAQANAAAIAAPTKPNPCTQTLSIKSFYPMITQARQESSQLVNIGSSMRPVLLPRAPDLRERQMALCRRGEPQEVVNCLSINCQLQFFAGDECRSFSYVRRGHRCPSQIYARLRNSIRRIRRAQQC